MSEPNLPTPEQLQQRLQEFFRASFAAPAQASPAESGEEPADQKAHPVFEFKLTPRDIKRHLDRFVIQQDEAKKALSIAVCDIYHHAQYAVSLPADEANRVDYAKQNVVLIGPPSLPTHKKDITLWPCSCRGSLSFVKPLRRPARTSGFSKSLRLISH
ncbi:MAG TPA: hypothetical protein VIS99_11480 [Terrimicrobiaceae bacterium]